LLQYWLRAFRKYGFTDVLINTHHHAEQVAEFVRQFQGPPNVSLFHEQTLLGSAGTVRENKAWLGDGEEFFIAYADNLTNANLAELVAFHRRTAPVATIGLFETEEPERCGVVEIDESGTISRFVEKSPTPPSRLANAGLYVASRRLFDFIPEKTPADFGFDVFPRMDGLLKGYRLRGYFLDIGDVTRLARAREDVRRIEF
jgi:mannose-1-phosphate guanylyltransferase